MRNYLMLAAWLVISPCYAQKSAESSVVGKYEQALDELVRSRDEAVGQAEKTAESIALNPYYFRVMAPGTYYSRPLHQVMGIEGTAANTPSAVEASDLALAQLYVNNPSLVDRAETVFKETPALREEIKAPEVVVESKLAENAVDVDLEADMPDTVAPVAKKPNFWKLKGSASLQFTQSYFSDNWYQGGENNYAGIGMLTLEANYDNQQKVQWDNKLEAQLGFQTASSDTKHKVRVTSNLLRLTSKLGYKAAKNWFYTGQVMTYTQLAPYYEKNTDTWKARFGTPWYLTLSVGMDYKFKSKNGKVELSVYLSPVAYYMTYVERLNTILDDGTFKYRYYGDMYGVTKENKGIYTPHSFHKFGPNFTVNSKIQLVKNVTWTSRLYWFSNFHTTLVEWENTFDFTINKYLSAKFYAYPRFDDSSIAYKNKHNNRGKYLMFKEWLSLGLSYNF